VASSCSSSRGEITGLPCFCASALPPARAPHWGPAPVPGPWAVHRPWRCHRGGSDLKSLSRSHFRERPSLCASIRGPSASAASISIIDLMPSSLIFGFLITSPPVDSICVTSVNLRAAEMLTRRRQKTPRWRHGAGSEESLQCQTFLRLRDCFMSTM